VLTVVDISIVSSTSIFAVRALSSSSTIFLSGKDISTYLTSLQSGDVKVQEIDFEALKADGGAPAAAQSSKQAKEKESAKIEGAVQIAVGVKKEVDFATWYTNVSEYDLCWLM
jgi:prolyl-tRNA synthetase